MENLMQNRLVRFDSEDLIYNRFDIIQPDKYTTHRYDIKDVVFDIQEYHDEGVSYMNLWGKKFPADVMNRFIEDAFSDIYVYAIELTRCGNQYFDFLEETKDIRVPLPNSFDELLNRAERRDRATIRRKLRWLDERIGSLKIDIFSKNEIPDSVVETYFDWKRKTHGTEYGLTPEEYIEKYYVTDAMLMSAGDTEVAVAFFCQVEDIVFFENFSYNGQLKEYSPGLLMYVKLMEELIRRKCRYLYLGGGSYIYKKRFGAESRTAYSGMIYRQEIVDEINDYFEHRAIRQVAFYGYGVCGHAFYQLSQNLSIEVLYGIDRNTDVQSDISLFLPEDDWPEVDAVLITLNNANKEVENLLSEKNNNVLYWNDILNEIISEYRRRIDESN